MNIYSDLYLDFKSEYKSIGLSIIPQADSFSSEIHVYVVNN